MDEIAATIARQRAWAQESGRSLSAGGFALAEIGDGVFGGQLDPATNDDLARGAGGELERLTSLRSSSALAVNFFAPWRPSPGPVAALLGGDPLCNEMRFEATYPTGLRGTPPHLDVVISGPGPIVAIESKFLEPYSPAHNVFRPAYLQNDHIWRRLPQCRELAERITDGRETFRWLGAAQLIKHAVGLAAAEKRFLLRHVWYRVDGPIADELAQEAARFGRLVRRDIDFESIAYQDLFFEVAELPEPATGYLRYLRSRYFGSR